MMNDHLPVAQKLTWKVPAQKGLNDSEVSELLAKYGRNELHLNDSRRFTHMLVDIFREPMFLLLIFACVLYFILGDLTEGSMMVIALAFVAAISVYQEMKSSKALEALQKLTEPTVKVIRNGSEEDVPSALIVPGDLLIVEEGQRIPADALVIQGSDFSVNESVLTGESFAVEKTQEKDRLFQGTLVNSGRCIAQVTATGNHTELGKIGRSIITYNTDKTLLQKQLDVFIRQFSLFGLFAFGVVFSVNYANSHDLVTGLLFGLTLAMSVIPEEIPVAFSSFMALGAYHMSRLGIISRQPQTIENLGAVNIICLDKTGTITENKMEVVSVFDIHKRAFAVSDPDKSRIVFYAFLACEEQPFDEMEKAIAELYLKLPGSEAAPDKVFEYPLEGKPPMMTHVFRAGEHSIVAAKGAVERIINVCNLDKDMRSEVLQRAREMAIKGHRVLAVASADHGSLSAFPENQDDFNWEIEGLISFYDPPKPFLKDIMTQFKNAGIRIKLLTGDFAETAQGIASEIGLDVQNGVVTGEQVMNADERMLADLCTSKSLFVRMFPDAKLRVIEQLKSEGNIVAMTGDGINDGPALRSANIGIAMGEKGTEVARQAADLIVTDDDLRKVVEAIRQGRKIFSNLKKAIRYIISIHIPIILTASLPLLFGWKMPNVFTPIHIVFLELIMGPTCSIFYEREPVEPYLMDQPPRKKSVWFFTKKEVAVSILQGLVIAAGILALYYAYMNAGRSLAEVRTLVFTTMLFSNVLLTFINRSFTATFLETIHYRNSLALPVLGISAVFIAAIHLIPWLRTLFGMAAIDTKGYIACILVSMFTTLWFEGYKFFLSRRNSSYDHKHRFI